MDENMELSRETYQLQCLDMQVKTSLAYKKANARACLFLCFFFSIIIHLMKQVKY